MVCPSSCVLRYCGSMSGAVEASRSAQAIVFPPQQAAFRAWPNSCAFVGLRLMVMSSPLQLLSESGMAIVSSSPSTWESSRGDKSGFTEERQWKELMPPLRARDICVGVPGKHVCWYLSDGDCLSGLGWWGFSEALSEQHSDLLQLFLSLLHIGILLQHLLQVRAARQIVLLDADTKHSSMYETSVFKWHFTQCLKN